MATVLERYNVAAGKPYTTRDGQDKKQWINIGRATKWDDGGISIEFTAMPVGNWWDGKASLFVDDGHRQQSGNDRPQSSRPARQESRPQRQAPQQPAPVDDFDDFDSQIPF